MQFYTRNIIVLRHPATPHPFLKLYLLTLQAILGGISSSTAGFTYFFQQIGLLVRSKSDFTAKSCCYFSSTADDYGLFSINWSFGT